jgi:RND family efflux transporter MFP subunit
VADEDLSRLHIDKSRITPTPARRRRKGWYIAAACVVALALAALFVVGPLRPATEVHVASVTQVYPAQAITLLNASGYVVAQRKSALASKVTGRLIWLGVEEGSRVKKDQVIARLESEDVEASKEQAEANVRNARSNIEFAKAELNDATLAMNRSKDLAAKGFIAQAEYDAAFARYQKAAASVSAAEAALKASTAALEAAKVALEYTQIRAPFDAVVLTKNADIGDIVSPISGAANAKAAVVTIADMGSLQVEVDVSESSLEKVKRGQPVEIQLDAFPDSRFRGQVHMIVPTADRSKASVMVKIRFVDADPRILPEMSAKVGFLSRPITTQEEKPRTAVNKAAVVKKNGRDILYTVQSTKVVETAVRLGPAIGDMLEVLEGVQAGDRIVLNPPATLRSGSRIKVAER